MLFSLNFSLTLIPPVSPNVGQKVTILAKKSQCWPKSYNYDQQVTILAKKVTLSFIKPKFLFSLNPLYIVSSVSDSLWEVESASKLVSLQFILQLETLHLKNKLAKLRRCASRVSFGRKSLGPVNLNFRQVKPWHPWHQPSQDTSNAHHNIALGHTFRKYLPCEGSRALREGPETPTGNLKVSRAYQPTDMGRCQRC